MADSPAAPTPYEILGVDPSASDAELRQAYRRLLRTTHPDTGGDPARFHAVQQAWARVGDKESRQRWDAGRHASGRHDAGRSAAGQSATDRSAAGQGATGRSATGQSATGGNAAGESFDSGFTRSGDPHSSSSGSSVRARAYGHPGGFARERFLTLMREWAGRGAEPTNPYDPAFVRSAPRELRHLLAQALAEEATARAVSGLGIGYTIWSGVATHHGTLDHAVLGPAGLFAVTSEDWGGLVRLVRGELVGEGIASGDAPVRALVRKARSLGRSSKVRFTATIVVVPDDDLDEPISHIGKKRDVAVVRLSALPMVLRDGLGAGQRLSIEDVFDVRTRLQQSVNFV